MTIMFRKPAPNPVSRDTILSALLSYAAGGPYPSHSTGEPQISALKKIPEKHSVVAGNSPRKKQNVSF